MKGILLSEIYAHPEFQKQDEEGQHRVLQTWFRDNVQSTESYKSMSPSDQARVLREFLNDTSQKGLVSLPPPAPTPVEKPPATWGETLKAAKDNAYTSMARSIGGLAQTVGDATGIDAVKKWGKDVAYGAQKELVENTPNVEDSPLKAAVYGGVQNFIQNLPGMALSAVTMNPLPALAIAGGQAWGESYAKGKEQGLTTGKNILTSGIDSVAEVALELVPLQQVLYQPSIVKKILFGSLADTLGENATTIIQEANDYLVRNPLGTVKDFVKTLPKALYDTTVQTLISMPPLALVGGGIQKIMGSSPPTKSTTTPTEPAATQETVKTPVDEGLAEPPIKKPSVKSPQEFSFIPQEERELFEKQGIDLPEQGEAGKPVDVPFPYDPKDALLERAILEVNPALVQSIPAKTINEYAKKHGITVKLPPDKGDKIWRLRKLLIDNPKGYDIAAGRTTLTDREYLRGDTAARRETIQKVPENKVQGKEPLDTLYEVQGGEIVQKTPGAIIVPQNVSQATKDKIQAMGEGYDITETGKKLQKLREAELAALEKRDITAQDLIPIKSLTGMVSLVNDVTQHPIKVKDLGNARGMYKPREQQIYINKNIKEDRGRTISATVAHELGHWTGFVQGLDMVLQRAYLSEGKTIAHELLQVNMEHVPFNPNDQSAYTKYRLHPPELTAVYMDAFLTNPDLVKTKAPLLTQKILDHINKNPNLKAHYLALIKAEKEGVYGQTVHALAAMDRGFLEGEQAKGRAIERAKFFSQGRVGAMSSWVDRFAAIHEAVGASKSSFASHEVRIKAEQYLSRFSPISAYVGRQWKEAVKPVLDAGIPYSTLSKYLALDRIATSPEYREQQIVDKNGNVTIKPPPLAPYGFDYKSAQAALDVIKMELGEEKAKILVDKVRQFRNIIQEDIVSVLAETGVFSEDQIKKMRDNTTYVTFDNIRFWDQKVGEYVTAGFKQVEGMLGKINDPIASTFLKHAALLRMALLSSFKNSIIDALDGTDEIKALKYQDYEKVQIYVGTEPGITIQGQKQQVPKFETVMRPKESRDRSYKLISSMKDGRLIHRYLYADLADALEHETIGTISGLSELARITAVVKEAFTKRSIPFSLSNVIRDFFRTARGLPEKAAHIKYVPFWLKGLKEGFQSLFKESQAYHEILKGGAIVSPYMRHAQYVGDISSMGRLLGTYGLEGGYAQFQQGALRRLGRNLLFFLSILSEGGERGGKIAANEYLKYYHPELSTAERMYRVRGLGSPRYVVSGKAMPYINIFKIFLNPAIQAWREDATLFQQNSKGKAFVTMATLTAMPFWYLVLATGGLDPIVGDYWSSLFKRWWSLIPSDHKKRGIPIPLFEDEIGKLHYILIPYDETKSVITGTIMSLLDGFFLNPNVSTADKIASAWKNAIGWQSQSFPNDNPVLQFPEDLYKIMSGKNVFNTFTGQEVFTPQELEMLRNGNMEAYGIAAKYIWGKYGGNNFIPFPIKNSIEAKEGWFDLVKGMPLLGSAIKRFYKVSDYGYQEYINSQLAPMRAQKAEEGYIYKQALQKQVQGIPLSKREEDVLLLYNKSPLSKFKDYIKESRKEGKESIPPLPQETKIEKARRLQANRELRTEHLFRSDEERMKAEEIRKKFPGYVP